MNIVRAFSGILGFVLLAISGSALAQSDDPGLPVPPRVGMVSGQASFWRNGAPDWTPAQVNMPLAAGDALYTSNGAALEIQVGTRAYVRLAQNAMLTLLDDEPRLQQFKVSSGIVSFDLRNLGGRQIEIDTPSGAYRIDSAGYYRVEIDDDTTHFIVRRGGQAIVTLADGNSRLIAPSQEAVVEAGDDARDVDTYVAPDMDSWDEWNLTRTDDLLDAISNRYVPGGVYGTDDLDRYGDWRSTPEYGAVWVPRDVGPDWVPYSTGAWIWDPVYTWTWVDAAPWGWAPYHYGRWVNVGGYWGWAPGPRHVRAIYAPALVAFFHSGNMTISITSGPAVSWVALGWGEPCVPWWGRSGFAGRPWWGGWGGPRVVNNVVINRTTINHIDIDRIHYRNAQQHHALVAVPQRDFGHGRVNVQRVADGPPRGFMPAGAQLPVKPAPTSLVPNVTRGPVPNASVLNRPAVVTREPPRREVPWAATRGRESRSSEPRNEQPTHADAPQNRIIKARPTPQQQIPDARFGRAGGAERQPRQLPPPPSFPSQNPSHPPNAQERGVRELQRGDVWRDIERVPSPQGNGHRLDVPDAARQREMPRGPVVEPPPVPAAPVTPTAPVAPRAQPRMQIDAAPQRDIQMPAPVPQRIPQREMQTPAPIPPRAPQREMQVPAPVPPRVQEQRQWQPPHSMQQQQTPLQMRFERRQDLPGQPANQMYRGHRRSDMDR